MSGVEPASSISYLEAVVVGVLQGVSELFPVSSLGHSVLLPALVGGRWATDLSVIGKGSPYLAVLVAMHVATALALVVFFWSDWVRIVRGLVASLSQRRISGPDQRLAWLLVVGTIPVGVAGLLLESALRTVLGKSMPAATFLLANGVVLYAVERQRSRIPNSHPPDWHDKTVDFSAAETMVLTPVPELASDRRLARLSWREAVFIGAAQSLALLPGISRSGITIVGGLLRGLRHDDAARFAFLLATPVILAAGVLKIPTLLDPANRAVLGPALLGSLAAGIASFVSVRFLTSYFETRTLTPFAVYCVLAGGGSLLYLTLAR